MGQRSIWTSTNNIHNIYLFLYQESNGVIVFGPRVRIAYKELVTWEGLGQAQASN
jgi:hypothetical protein